MRVRLRCPTTVGFRRADFRDARQCCTKFSGFGLCFIMVLACICGIVFVFTKWERNLYMYILFALNFFFCLLKWWQWKLYLFSSQLCLTWRVEHLTVVYDTASMKVSNACPICHGFDKGTQALTYFCQFLFCHIYSILDSSASEDLSVQNEYVLCMAFKAVSLILTCCLVIPHPSHIKRTKFAL